ncbi:thiazole synthase [uncultured Clostridium sp.]|uniref:thiazole synthase n=1 Tax=uncultured Clostridium sp. TaxID=59620 RepID=UPI00261554F9|nr:thiazole synthase [uncultured Clostridium sp.]
MKDELKIGGKVLSSRLFIGSGKTTNIKVPEIIEASGSQVITMAVRRVDLQNTQENIVDYIPKDMILMPNTSGARNAQEAVRIARIAKAMGLGNWIKIEVINDSRYLMPDNIETLKATQILSKEGFEVFAYMNPDLTVGRYMMEAGAAAVMPLAAPIGTNRGLRTKEIIQLMIDELDTHIIVDAGIGMPSHAAEAMEMGASAVLLNTAISSSNNPVLMAEAFKDAVKAGRNAYLAKGGEVSSIAKASSPLLGFLD